MIEVIDLTGSASALKRRRLPQRSQVDFKQRRSIRPINNSGPGRMLPLASSTTESSSVIKSDGQSSGQERVGKRRKRSPLGSNYTESQATNQRDSFLAMDAFIPFGVETTHETQTPCDVDFTHEFSMASSSGTDLVTIEDTYTVTYTSCPATLSRWTRALPRSTILGFDTEGEGEVTQLCSLSNSAILIFAMPRRRAAACIDALSQVMTSRRYLKVGIAAFHDAIKLYRKFGISANGVFDLTYLASDLRISDAGTMSRTFRADQKRGVLVIQDIDTEQSLALHHGLKALFDDLFKSQFQRLSSLPSPRGGTPRYVPPRHAARGALKWTTHPLRKEELLYAAKDALFGVLLYHKMITMFSESEVMQLRAEASLEFQHRMEKGRHDIHKKRKVQV